MDPHALAAVTDALQALQASTRHLGALVTLSSWLLLIGSIASATGLVLIAWQVRDVHRTTQAILRRLPEERT